MIGIQASYQLAYEFQVNKEGIQLKNETFLSYFVGATNTWN